MILAAGLIAVVLAFRPSRPRRPGVPTGRPNRPSGVLGRSNQVDVIWTTVVASVLIGLAAGTPLFVVAAPVVGLGSHRHRRNRRQQAARRNDAVAVMAFADRTTEGLRGGTSLTNAIAQALMPGAEVGDVLRQPRLQQLSDAIAGGRSLAAATDEITDDENLAVDECLVFTTITALLRSGGAALAAVERVSDTLRERESSEEDLRTQAQQAFSSAAVMSALPIVFAGAAALADAQVAHFYRTTWLGAGCVASSLLLTAAGWEWQQQLLERAR